MGSLFIIISLYLTCAKLWPDPITTFHVDNMQFNTWIVRLQSLCETSRW